MKLNTYIYGTTTVLARDIKKGLIHGMKQCESITFHYHGNTVEGKLSDLETSYEDPLCIEGEPGMH